LEQLEQFVHPCGLNFTRTGYLLLLLLLFILKDIKLIFLNDFNMIILKII
jgi:hypothetical protein